MILVVSTSSPQLSVAVLTPGIAVRAGSAREARNDGHRVLHELLDEVLGEAECRRADVTGLVVDVGPGGFTSVRIGVTFAKFFAYLTGCRIWSIEAFDLIAHDGTVAVPSRRGEWFVRAPQQSPVVARAITSGTRGYGSGFEEAAYPDARRASLVRERWRESDPMALVPFYLAEPSISKPKAPFGQISGASE